MKRFLSGSILALTIACLLSSGGCGDDDDPFDPWGDCGDSCIGPGGGSVSIEDPSHGLYGVRIDVPAGAWDREWAVYMGWETTFTTPNFPDGLEGYEGWLTGSLNLEISAFAPPDEQPAVPDSLYMEITFPLRDLVCETGEVFTIYRYDETVERWRLELPDARTDSTITVHTYDHASLWTWGIVAVHEADWDLYLEPVMEEQHGSSAWANVELALQEAYAAAIDHDLAINCANLALVRNIFVAMRDETEVAIVAHQDGLGGLCRVCDVTTALFWDEYLEYISLNIEAFFMKFFLVDNGPNFLIQVYGIIRVCQAWEEIDALACDYECFWQNADSAFYDNLALYCVASLIVRAIDFAYDSEYIDCPT